LNPKQEDACRLPHSRAGQSLPFHHEAVNPAGATDFGPIVEFFPETCFLAVIPLKTGRSACI